tara:strand:+ start:921 stop:2093 length:1173 start_codon:yes stop_codon:yes gene_type:complete
MKRTASSICLLALLCACGADSTAEFGPPTEVPKSKRAINWDASTRDRLGVGDMGAPTAGSPATGGSGQQGPTRVVADVPNGWEELPPAPARFRNAVWRIKGEDATDIYLTIGVGGGVPGNLRRWYVQQFGKTVVPAVEALPPVDLADRPGRLVEIEGTFGGKQDWAALIAFYNEGSAVTSLKFTGPKLIVAANKKEFLMLAKSIRFAAQSPNAKAPPIRPGQALPEGHAPIGNGGNPAASANTPPAPAPAPFTATTPEGWTKKEGRRILNHTFGRGSELYISQLGGTLRQSLDIWRAEISVGGTRLSPLTDSEYNGLAKTLFLGDDAVLMDLSGKFQGMTGNQIENARLLVAARLDGSTITFCKLVGPKDEIDAQHAAFVQFCGSVRRAQ